MSEDKKEKPVKEEGAAAEEEKLTIDEILDMYGPLFKDNPQLKAFATDVLNSFAHMANEFNTLVVDVAAKINELEENLKKLWDVATLLNEALDEIVKLFEKEEMPSVTKKTSNLEN